MKTKVILTATFFMFIILFSSNLLFSNDFTNIYTDTTVTCKVKITGIEYSKKESIFL